MNYSKHYYSLITTRQSLYDARNAEKKSGIYYEKHHIIPRCYDGGNTKDNLVWLTAREHFIAHCFGKNVLSTYPNANDYNPRHFTKMVRWFQQKEQ